MAKNKFYITTTIPYVNAAPHIGHALEFVQADVIARYRRIQGAEVYFLSGTDENAIKNLRAAQDAGVPVQEFVDQNAEIFRVLLSKLNISINQFIRTTEERHKKGAQALWEQTDKKYIYKKTYQGLYCVGCELFYKPEELNEKGECLEHPGKKPEFVEEENYFFRLSEFQQWLKELIETDKLRIIPESRKKETLSFIAQGLEDFSISRPVERSQNWGVPVPGDKHQTMYVWYDANANYITALGYPDTNSSLYKNFWEKNENKIHILGKGVLRFHVIYWPAMLKAANLPIPNLEFIHGYITVDGKKMSKSLGNVVDPFELVEKYGTDAVRYYLLREIPATEDGDFTYEKFEQRYNSDLAKGLGNLVARVINLAKISNFKFLIFKQILNPKFKTIINKTWEDYKKALDEFKFNEALIAIWDLISFCDRYIEKEKPWQTENQKSKIKNQKVIVNLLFTIDEIAKLLDPFLPDTSKEIIKQIKIKKSQPLFPGI
jgi:methionyl-tRNA synthetase